jgi:cell division protein FtsQ
MRGNRRKPAPRKPLKMPRLRINFRALLLVPAVAAAVLAGCAGTRVLLDQRITTLVLEGRFQRVTPAQLESALADQPALGFLSVDLRSLISRLQDMDWIDSVKIQRRWPDALVVRFSEHVAAARWGETGLLNVRGELFTENAHAVFPELPRLYGPTGTEKQVGALYAAVRGRLIEAGLALESLTLDERGAWRLSLSSGQEIRLGHQDVAERLERFFDVAIPGLSHRFGEVAYVDLRYTNGFAIGWAPGSQLSLLTTAEGRGGRG